MENRILTIDNKPDERFLRQRTENFDFQKFSRKEREELVRKMRETMKKANGIGLAANQIGLNFRVFVAQIPKTRINTDVKTDKHGYIRVNPRPNPRESVSSKFYAIFNPEIIKSSKEKDVSEEGCLSVPGGIFGQVERPAKIVISGFDKNGKKIKIKAWGLLAKVFQHEVDHLDGKLFIDKAKELYEYRATEHPQKNK